MILQFCRCGGLWNAKGHPDGFLSHFSSLRNFWLGGFSCSLTGCGPPVSVYSIRPAVNRMFSFDARLHGALPGTACRSRRSTCSSYKVSIKRYAPIASVAAFPERLQAVGFAAQIHWRRANRFVIPRSEATWESRSTMVNNRNASAKTQPVAGDCRVGLRPPRNDNSGAFTILTRPCLYRRCSAGPGCLRPCNDKWNGRRKQVCGGRDAHVGIILESDKKL